MGPSKPQSTSLLGNREPSVQPSRNSASSKLLAYPVLQTENNPISVGSASAIDPASSSGAKISGPLDHPSKVLSRNPKSKERRSFASKLKDKFFGRIVEEVEEEAQDDTIVSTPFNVQHNIHVDFDSETGFSVRNRAESIK